MLRAYRFQNFQSFRDKAEITFALNERANVGHWARRSADGSRFVTAMAIMGANGAGKTVALKPLAFAEWFVRDSFAAPADDDLPVQPHPTRIDEATSIEVDFEDADGTAWRYELACTPRRVVREALFRKYARFRHVFQREWSSTASGYEIRQQDFGMSSKEAAKVRQNASLISTAVQYDLPVAKHVASAALWHNVTTFGRHHFQPSTLQQAAQFYAANDALKTQMSTLLRAWDLGLKDVEIQRLQFPREDGTTQEEWHAIGVHDARDGTEFRLHLGAESSGTQSAFLLLARLLPALAVGGIAVIDELDNDLHPAMIEPVLDLFASPITNPRGAQVVFSCHSPAVLDVLHAEQVVFVEKRDCESVAYRADQIEGLRAQDNLRAKYMSGALGAVPRL